MSIDASLVGSILLSLSATASVGNDELNERDPGSNTITMDQTYKITKSKGSTVSAAKQMSLNVSSQAVTYNGQGQIDPGNQTIKFSISKHNTTAAVSWFIAPLGGTLSTAGDGFSGDNGTLSAARFNTVRGNSNGVTVIARATDGGLLLEEQVSVLALRSAAVNEPTVAAASADYTNSTNWTAIGDSIAVGIGENAGSKPSNWVGLRQLAGADAIGQAREGAAGAEIVRRAKTVAGKVFDYAVISCGSNNPTRDLPAQLRAIRASLNSTKRVIWLMPVVKSSVINVQDTVRTVAAERGDPIVTFTSNDGVHPSSPKETWRRIVAAVPAAVTKDAAAPAAVTTAPSTTTEQGSYLAVLTNERHILATDPQGSGGNFTDAGGTLRMFDGTTEVTTGRNIHYSVANISEGLQITVDENTGIYKIAGLTADTGTATIRATFDADSVDGGGDIPSEGIAGSEAGGAGGSSIGVGAGAGTSDGGAGGGDDSFITCRTKYGLSADEATAIQNEGSAHPFGTTPEGLARERAVNAARDADADPTDATSNDAKATPIGCEGCTNASDTFQLSPRFTVHDLSIHCDASPTRIGNGSRSIDPVTGANRVYGRAEIICNLRHLCVNALEPIFNHFLPLGYTIQITSGYRTGRGDKSDHPKGSAADLRIYYKGQRIGGRHLTRVQMAIDQIVRVPYTQMIFETPSSNGDILHVACRRVGGRSSLRNCWSSGNGHGGSTRSGYKYNVGINDGPPVK